MTLAEAPLCLLRLEFLLPEEKFVSSVDEAEKILQQEKEQLRRNENVKATLQKHKV
jgi:heme exporter protein D